MFTNFSFIDKEAVSELETRIKHERNTGGEKTYYFGGLFLVLCGRPDKGRDYFNRLLKMTNGQNMDVGLHTLNAWWPLVTLKYLCFCNALRLF